MAFFPEGAKATSEPLVSYCSIKTQVFEWGISHTCLSFGDKGHG